MKLSSVCATLSLAAAAVACTPPTDTPSNNISEGFAIQVQNASYPEIHNRLLNQWAAGGGDQHLYLSPAGAPTSDLTLVDGIITQLNGGKTIRAVINGEVSNLHPRRGVNGTPPLCPDLAVLTETLPNSTRPLTTPPRCS